MTNWKCPNCKKTHETESKGKNGVVTVLCSCGYYMEQMEEKKE
jgi:Zn ribbon nucleic-acid-binding protein